MSRDSIKMEKLLDSLHILLRDGKFTRKELATMEQRLLDALDTLDRRHTRVRTMETDPKMRLEDTNERRDRSGADGDIDEVG